MIMTRIARSPLPGITLAVALAGSAAAEPVAAIADRDPAMSHHSRAPQFSPVPRFGFAVDRSVGQPRIVGFSFTPSEGVELSATTRWSDRTDGLEGVLSLSIRF